MKTNMYLMMLLLTLTAFRSNATRIITGTIYDHDDHKPVTGVVINVEGTKTYSSSDANGYYSIKVNDNDKVLIFKMLGYDTKRVQIQKSDLINVDLNPSKQLLEEVVMTAFPAGKRNGKISASQVIKGRTPGIYVTNTPPPSSHNTESYKTNPENRFTDPRNTPLSTFAIDVDAASYSNFRRFINNGQLPPKDAIRAEEMINYFNYNLPGPVNSDPVAIHTELSSAPWNPAHHLLRIGLRAKSIKKEELPPSNLVFLLDISGSMADANKLPLVKSSIKLLVDQLTAKDHVAIVTYSGEVGLKLGSTPGDQKDKIKNAIDELQASGSTAGGEGIKMAYRIARENYIKKGNNRIILATDGDFNVGESEDEDMEKLVTKENQSGISMSVLGFGIGNLKDSKMETIADKGHGNYAYIDNISEARKAMVTEFEGTLFTVAKDVKIQIEFNPGKVQAYRLIGYENRLLQKEDFNNDQKTGGDMGVRHTVTALYELIPTGIKDEYTSTVDPLKYQKTVPEVPINSSSELATIKFRYKDPGSGKSEMVKTILPDISLPLSKTTDDFRFASAVAELSQLLNDSEYKQQSDFDSLISRAKAAKGKDEEGYRAEFINLAKSTQALSKSVQSGTGTK